jgi:hypothetical protein
MQKFRKIPLWGILGEFWDIWGNFWFLGNFQNFIFFYFSGGKN